MPIRSSLLALVVCGLLGGCAPLRLAGYAALPDYPTFEEGQRIAIDGLKGEVAVARRSDGLWKISARSENDALHVEGYLAASDRMFQLDLFRHMARGELAAMIGNRPFGTKTTLDADIYNRFLGFHRDALQLLEHTSTEERAALQAYVDGINAWIDSGPLPLEHRLLNIDRIRSWEPADSLAIYLLLMHSLSGNADREIRRLLIACEIGLDAMERVFPTNIEFGAYTLPEEAFSLQTYALPPAIVPEIRAALPALCRSAATARQQSVPVLDTAGRNQPLQSLALLSGELSSLSASNSWVLTGPLTASGFPLLSNDPHLPHMNPPIVWGVEMISPENHVAGFTIPGLHRVVFGHNGRVGWGATTNHVDRQDLVIHKPRSQRQRNGSEVSGYEVDGKFVAFEIHREHFEIAGAEGRDVSVRFTTDGPLLNDLEPQLAGRIPLTALRRASLGEGRDLDGARAVNRAHSADELVGGINRFDQGCSNWVFVDVAGSFGYRSPCRLPIRRGWQGAFPIPGWLSRYRWDGYVPKNRLPVSTNPDRGWLVTANAQVVPARRFFTPYNNDSQAPNRMLRIAERISEGVHSGITRESSAAIQMDVMHQPWPRVRAELGKGFCRGTPPGLRSGDAELRRQMCAWDGSFGPGSTMATLFVLWSNALLDRALADELPGGASNETWRYVQTLPQFEAVAQWLWTRGESDPIWNDATTAARETRTDILTSAFTDAANEARRRYGNDPARWQWGTVRPFVLRHPFAGQDGIAGQLFNSEALEIGGDVETVFKQQFVRSDRDKMNVAVGPVVRFTVDMSEPWKATYSLAGGESGWAGSPYYGNLLPDWAAGRGRPLTPPPAADDLHLRFVPD